MSEQFGRYAILAEIGRGGMATVYRAYDPRFEREVALKVLPPQLLHDPTFQTRFAREAKIIATLEHTAIVPVYDFGEEAGQPYYVMRLMSGGSLADVLQKGPVSPREAARILSRIAEGLDEAHSHGFIHRDLKPGNILFDTRNTPYLSDFGIAKLVQTSTPITASNVVIGTPAYMSPEQGRGERDMDGRSDVYALGALLFQMLSGRVPYESETPTGQIIKHITEPIPNILELKPDLPAGIQTVIERSMAKDREQRYISASEMAQALVRAVNGEPVTPPSQSFVADETLVSVEQALPLSVQEVEPVKPPSAPQDKPASLERAAPPSSPALAKPVSSPAYPRPVVHKRSLPVWGWVSIGVAALLVFVLVIIGFVFLPGLLAEEPQPTSAEPGASLINVPQPSHTPRPPASDTSTAEPPAAQYVVYKAIAKVDALPVRSGPGQLYFVIDRYPKGVEFDVIGRSEDSQWLTVRVPMTDNTGWVRIEQVIYEGDPLDLVVISVTVPPSDTPQPSNTPGALVDEDAARLRSGPGMNYDILVVLTRGTGLVVQGRSANAEWLLVFVPDEEMSGWIAVSTLLFDFDLDELEIIVPPPSPTPRPDLPTETPKPKKPATSAPPDDDPPVTPYP